MRFELCVMGWPESGKTLMYIGGHIRKEDELGAPEPTLIAISKLALMREVKEETGINFFPSDSDPLCHAITHNFNTRT